MERKNASASPPNSQRETDAALLWRVQAQATGRRLLGYCGSHALFILVGMSSGCVMHFIFCYGGVLNYFVLSGGALMSCCAGARKRHPLCMGRPWRRFWRRCLKLGRGARAVYLSDYCVCVMLCLRVRSATGQVMFPTGSWWAPYIATGRGFLICVLLILCSPDRFCDVQGMGLQSRVGSQRAC